MADLLIQLLNRKEIIQGSSYVLDLEDTQKAPLTACAEFCDHDVDEVECHVEPVREHDTYIALCDCSPSKPTRFLRIMFVIFVIVGILSSLTTVWSIVCD